MSGSPKPSTSPSSPRRGAVRDQRVRRDGIRGDRAHRMEVNWSHRNRPCAVKARTSQSRSPADTGALAPFTKVSFGCRRSAGSRRRLLRYAKRLVGARVRRREARRVDEHREWRGGSTVDPAVGECLALERDRACVIDLRLQGLARRDRRGDPVLPAPQVRFAPSFSTYSTVPEAFITGSSSRDPGAVLGHDTISACGTGSVAS